VNLPQLRRTCATVLCGSAGTFLVLVSAYPAEADVLTGRIYRLGESEGPPLFTWRLEREADGSSWRSLYRTPAGELAAADETVWQGGELQSYRYERPPLGESARLERQGDELAYEQRIGGVTRCNRERFDERVTVGPTVIPWAQRHWSDLMAGPERVIRYAVLDQLRSFEFQLAMAHDHPRADREAVIQMWPASLALRLFVSPVYLIFTRDGRVFRGMVGRLLPVAVHHGRPRAIDGQLVLDVGEGGVSGDQR
jgi:hypothetical protein